MSNSSLDRYRRRKQIRNLSATHSENIENEEVKHFKKHFLNSEVNKERVDSLYARMDSFYDMSVSEKEIDDFLKKFKEEFNNKKFSKLVSDCKRDVINSIVSPFGLGKIVAAYDKVGGNVTTLHNFKQGVVATEEDQQRYDEYQKSNESYDRSPYDKAETGGKKGNFNTNKKAEIYADMQEGEKVKGGYTGDILGEKKNGNIDKEKQIDLEHITSAKEIETDPTNHLFAEGNTAEERQSDRVNLATDDRNLTLEEGSLNSSKGDQDLIEWANAPVSKKHAEETGNPEMTNAEYYNLDKEKLETEYKKSKDMINSEQRKKQIKKQGKELIDTGLNEGAKMATQQAIGLLMTEFFTAVFDEIIDIYNNGFYDEFDDRFLNTLKKRLKKIGNKLKAKWKDVAIAFKDGFVSGFISNLVTTAINAFVTTAKRTARIVREGAFSLFKAIKILLFPPKDMTLQERMDEAKKLIATGIIVSIGVIAEEYIEALVSSSGVLAPYSSVLSAVFVGAITGLSITMVIYYLDKKKNDSELLSELFSQTDQKFTNIENMVSLSNS